MWCLLGHGIWLRVTSKLIFVSLIPKKEEETWSMSLQGDEWSYHLTYLCHIETDEWERKNSTLLTSSWNLSKKRNIWLFRDGIHSIQAFWYHLKHFIITITLTWDCEYRTHFVAFSDHEVYNILTVSTFYIIGFDLWVVCMSVLGEN